MKCRKILFLFVLIPLGCIAQVSVVDSDVEVRGSIIGQQITKNNDNRTITTTNNTSTININETTQTGYGINVIGDGATIIINLPPTSPTTEEKAEQEEQAVKGINNNFKFLPLGIHQFATKQTGKGILFAGTQAGLLGIGLGYYSSAKSNLEKHKSSEYEKWERDRFYDKYQNQRNLSRYFLAGAGVSILLNYFDNFNWFRKMEVAVNVKF